MLMNFKPHTTASKLWNLCKIKKITLSQLGAAFPSTTIRSGKSKNTCPRIVSILTFGRAGCLHNYTWHLFTLMTRRTSSTCFTESVCGCTATSRLDAASLSRFDQTTCITITDHIRIAMIIVLQAQCRSGFYMRFHRMKMARSVWSAYMWWKSKMAML